MELEGHATFPTDCTRVVDMKSRRTKKLMLISPLGLCVDGLAVAQRSTHTDSRALSFML